jgi:hypothetical protein
MLKIVTEIIFFYQFSPVFFSTAKLRVDENQNFVSLFNIFSNLFLFLLYFCNDLDCLTALKKHLGSIALW